MVVDGWLQDSQRFWTVRFHRDPDSLIRDVRVFVDHGREMPDGEPALLKSRRQMRYDDAIALWKQLVRSGWTVVEPVW